MQPRDYIAGNKRVVSVDLTARKRLKLLQTEQAMAVVHSRAALARTTQLKQHRLQSV